MQTTWEFCLPQCDNNQTLYLCLKTIMTCIYQGLAEDVGSVSVTGNQSEGGSDSTLHCCPGRVNAMEQNLKKMKMFIFLTQGLNPGVLYCKHILYHLSHQGSSKSCFFSNLYQVTSFSFKGLGKVPWHSTGHVRSTNEDLLRQQNLFLLCSG